MKRMVFATMALAASVASWADVGLYGGGSLGTTVNDLNCHGDPACHVDTSSTGWKLYGGYRVTPIVGAELTYFDFGKANTSETSGGVTTDGDVKTRAVGIGAGFHFDLTPQWSTDFHLGYAMVKSTSTTLGVKRYAHKDTPYVGLDAGFLVTKGLRIRAGWDFTSAIEAFTHADYHVNLFSVGGSYEF